MVNRILILCVVFLLAGLPATLRFYAPPPAMGSEAASHSHPTVASAIPTSQQDLFVQRFLRSFFASVIEWYLPAAQQEDLTIGNFFSSGWNQGWSEPEEGPNDAPRFRLLRIQRAFWERELRLTYNFTFRGDEPSADEQEGEFELELPVSRRFLIEFEGGAVALRPEGQHWRTRGADLNVIPEVMLVQTRTLSFSSGFAVRTPTGGRAAEQGHTSVAPYLALWKDLGHRVGLHTFVGGEIPLGGFGPNAPDAVFEYGLAPTVTVTAKEKPYLGDLTFFVELNGDTNLRGADHGASTVTVLPGTRWMVLSGLWFATGCEVPVVATHQLSSRLWLSIYLDF